jgi:Uma2 family endonuclease
LQKNRLGIIGEKNIQGAPDITIEILSEATAYRDLVKKKKIYAKFGVKEYWIVDPVEKTIDLYTMKEMSFALMKSFAKNETFESTLLHGFTMNLVKIFAYWK